MNANIVYRIFSILLGIGLIIGGFIAYGESLETNVLILDVVASCIVYAQFVELLVFPMIRTSRPGHREVGMMGVHYLTITLCAIISLTLVGYGIAYKVEFRHQLMGQLAVLLVLVLGRVSTLTGGEKVKQVYEREQDKMVGKKSLKAAMDEFMLELVYVKEFDKTQRVRLQKLQEDIGYITPSIEYDARRAEDQMTKSLDELKVLLQNAKLNKTKIEEAIIHLEVALSRRKKF